MVCIKFAPGNLGHQNPPTQKAEKERDLFFKDRLHIRPVSSALTVQTYCCKYIHPWGLSPLSNMDTFRRVFFWLLKSRHLWCKKKTKNIPSIQKFALRIWVLETLGNKMSLLLGYECYIILIYLHDCFQRPMTPTVNKACFQRRLPHLIGSGHETK